MAGVTCHSSVKAVERQHIPLANLYETMGLDRALSLLGAGEVYGWPVLVVDCGTALTFTAGAWSSTSSQGQFLGGAILPGLGTQFRALHDYTDQLPWVDHLTISWPDRWAKTTEDAIASGILYTQLAGVRDFLQDWWLSHPQGKVVFTGGDGETMAHYLQQREPSLIKAIYLDLDVMFWGLRTYRQLLIEAD
jgi:type III pantothenate kinase